jgi:hypothetical protein
MTPDFELQSFFCINYCCFLSVTVFTLTKRTDGIVFILERIRCLQLEAQGQLTISVPLMLTVYVLYRSKNGPSVVLVLE